MSLRPDELGSDVVPAPSEGPETQLLGADIIMLFGCTGTGKTSFANIASGSDLQVGEGLRSSTKHLQASKTFQVDGQSIAIVDCPGFNDTYLTETEILRRLADYLIKAYTSKYRIVGFLYFHKISDTRVGGASFLHMNLFKELCGPEALKQAVYVTNMWSDPPTESEVLREAELRDTDKFFGAALAEGAQTARHSNTQESAHRIIRKLLGKGPVIAKLQRELVDENKPLEETGAGLVIGEDLEDDLRQQQQEMEEMKEEKKKALESNNQIWIRRLEAQEERTKAREQQLAEQLQALKASKPKQAESAIRRGPRDQTRDQNLRIQDSRDRTTRNRTSRDQSPRDQSSRDRGRTVNLDSPAQLVAQMEARLNEQARKSSPLDRKLDTSLSSQQAWDKQREEELARDLARIQAQSTRSQTHVPVNVPINAPLSSQEEWDRRMNDETLREVARMRAESANLRSHDNGPGMLDAVVGGVKTAVNVVGNVMSAFSGGPGRSSGTSSSTGHSHRSKTNPSTARRSSMEDVTMTFTPTRETQTGYTQDTHHRHENTGGGSGRRRTERRSNTYDEREGHASSSRKQGKGHKSTNAPDRRCPSPRY